MEHPLKKIVQHLHGDLKKTIRNISEGLFSGRSLTCTPDVPSSNHGQNTCYPNGGVGVGVEFFSLSLSEDRKRNSKHARHFS
jgi:hypothetical protein